MTRWFAALALAALFASPAAAQDAPRWSFAIHGGAGVIERASLTPEQDAAYRAALHRALEAGSAVLAAGGSSLDAVQAAIELMEDDPLFNAGRGAVFTAAGLAVHRRSPDEMVFERPATRGERGAYGTWFGEDVRVRLRVDFQLQNHGVYLLRCRCFIARDAGTHAEDEQSLARRRVRKYAGLLDQVSKRLN